MKHAVGHVVAYLRRRLEAGATLEQVADEIDAGALGRERAERREVEALPPVVHRPRQVSTLPEARQKEALAHVERIAERNRQHGTEPLKVPKGGQRT